MIFTSDQSINYETDMHEELSIVKEDVRNFRKNRRKKKEKIKGYLGEVGLNKRYVVIEKDKKKKKS